MFFSLDSIFGVNTKANVLQLEIPQGYDQWNEKKQYYVFSEEALEHDMKSLDPSGDIGTVKSFKHILLTTLEEAPEKDY